MQSLRPTTRTVQPADAQPKRRAAAAVEFAVCLPLMLLITFGAIEAANGIYLKQIVTQAAYEAARVASTPGRTKDDALAIAQEILAARKTKDAVITIAPQVTSSTKAGTDITVTVMAPSNSNAYAPLWYFKGAEISATVVMVRN